MTRKAFTLVEVMVALVVTGLVVSMAYASMQAGMETADRIESAQAGEEREAVARSLLTHAIRHAVPGTIGGEPVFSLLDVAGGDELRFRTRGVSEPLGASELWEVSLTSGRGGVELAGFAVDDRAKTFDAVLPRIASVDIRVRGRDYRDGWFESWPITDRSPVAVSIRFLATSGRPVGSDLSTRVGFESTP